MGSSRARCCKRAGLGAGLLLAVLGPLLVFGALAEEVAEREPIPWDHPLLSSILSHRMKLLDAPMAFLTGAGGGVGLLVLVALVIALLLWRRRLESAIFFAVAVEGARLASKIIKELFSRPRPDIARYAFPGGHELALIGVVAMVVIVSYPTRWRRPALLFGSTFLLALGLELLLDRWVFESAHSFPSGHAVGSMAFAVALFILAWPTRWRLPIVILGGLFVLAVGISRVYMGFHYPSDVLAGWAVSVPWVVGLWLLFQARQLSTATGISR
ncbi:MAG: phosphatase PAP2 family protein [Actinomycetota bacterium]